MRIINEQKLKSMYRTHIIENVSDKQYAKSQAIIRANGNLPRDCTLGGEVMVLELGLDCSYLQPTPSGRLVKKYQVINVKKDSMKAGGEA